MQTETNRAITRLVNTVRSYNESIRSIKQTREKLHMRSRQATLIMLLCRRLTNTGHRVIMKNGIRIHPGYAYLSIDGIEYPV